MQALKDIKQIKDVPKMQLKIPELNTSASAKGRPSMDDVVSRPVEDL